MVTLDDLCPSAPSARLPPLGGAWSCWHWGQLCVPTSLGTAQSSSLGGTQLYVQHAQPPCARQWGALRGWSPACPARRKPGNKRTATHCE